VRALRPDISTELALMTPGSMSFADQLRAVRRARLLVAFHGAALAHLLFAHPAAAVLELTAIKYWTRSHFTSLARNVGRTMMLLVAPGIETLGDQFWLPPGPVAEAVALLAPPPTCNSTR
jgi:capsular polysaccharide biosynthesis protein